MFVVESFSAGSQEGSHALSLFVVVTPHLLRSLQLGGFWQRLSSGTLPTETPYSLHGVTQWHFQSPPTATFYLFFPTLLANIVTGVVCWQPITLQLLASYPLRLSKVESGQ